MAEGCTLSILVSRPDVPFMMHTIPHIVRSCRYPFGERVLIVDTAPLHKRYRTNPNIATLDQLRACCRQLIDRGVIDTIIEIDYGKSSRATIAAKHYGQRLSNTHDFRGCPVLALPTAIEHCKTPYLLHFDPDVLLHHAPEFDWISWGIDLLRRRPDVMFVCPRPGPPDPTGTLKQGSTYYERDPDGFFRFKVFSQRKFLIDRDKLCRDFLPLKPVYTSTRRRWLGILTGQSALWTWEFMMDSRLKETKFIRADLDSSKAWTLHAPDHGPEFVVKLPQVIGRVEAGDFPANQAGDYDLRLEKW